MYGRRGPFGTRGTLGHCILKKNLKYGFDGKTQIYFFFLLIHPPYWFKHNQQRVGKTVSKLVFFEVSSKKTQQRTFHFTTHMC